MTPTTPDTVETMSYRPGPRAWLTMMVAEAKMVFRDTIGMLIPLALPLLMLVMNASAANDDVILNGRTELDLFVLPIVLMLVISIVGIANMPTFLAGYRGRGVLRRLAVTPASPLMVMVAQVVVSMVLTLVGIALALTVAMLAFDANPPVHLMTALGIGAVASGAMYAVGMLVASVANAAIAISLILILGMAALGGLFGGPEALPDALEDLGEMLPFGAGVTALGEAWTGEPVEMQHVISLAATLVIGTTASALLFRWD